MNFFTNSSIAVETLFFSMMNPHDGHLAVSLVICAPQLGHFNMLPANTCLRTDDSFSSMVPILRN